MTEQLLYHTPVLDHGYIALVDSWGSDESVIRAARMSTDKGFLGFGPVECGCMRDFCPHCGGTGKMPGDEKLLAYLWRNAHHTPFELAGMVFEVKAPIFVFREWHRHRAASLNEMSARYTPLPDENYLPSLERLTLHAGTKNKQAQGTSPLQPDEAVEWRNALEKFYRDAQALYDRGLKAGVPKELARVCLPVARYSKMRWQANLRMVLHFLKLRKAGNAQHEIQVYAEAMAKMVAERFPRTYEVVREEGWL